MDGVEWLSEVLWLFGADNGWEIDEDDSLKVRGLDGAEAQAPKMRSLAGGGSPHHSQYMSLAGGAPPDMTSPPAPPNGPPAPPRKMKIKLPRLTNLVKVGCMKVRWHPSSWAR